MKISVALCTYNGDKYLKSQIESIIKQLKQTDELIISDDLSNDATVKIINNYMKCYDNIKLIEGPKKGFVKNFENAINNCSGDIICLSDQDDVWACNKIKEIKNVFETRSEIALVLHNMAEIDKTDHIIKNKVIHYSPGVFKNILKSSYYGCCMCFRRKFVEKYMPFINYVVAHDQYISLFAELHKNVFFLDKELIFHRIHDSNVSKRSNILAKIGFRFRILYTFIVGVFYYEK